MTNYEFTTELKIIGVNPFVSVPSEILVALFKASGREKSPIPVCGLINNQAYQQNLMFFKGQWRLYVNMKMLKNSPQRIGERLEVTISYDPKPRLVEQPEALRVALSENSAAKQVFNQLTPSKQLEINRYIAKLKTQEAVERNVARAIGFLLGQNRFIGREKP